MMNPQQSTPRRSSTPDRNWTLTKLEKEVYDMEQNKLKTAQVTQESVDSTRRMLALVDECQDAGVNTLRMLQSQGEALNRTELALEEIEVDIRDGDKTLKRISCMEKVPCPFLPLYLLVKKKPPPTPVFDPRKMVSDDAEPVEKPVRRWSSADRFRKWRNSKQLLRTGSTEKFFKPITGEPEEEVIENNLAQVSKHLSELKSQASTIGSTIKTQNSQVDRIQTKTENNDILLDAVNKKTRKILNSDRSSTSASTDAVSIINRTQTQTTQNILTSPSLSDNYSTSTTSEEVLDKKESKSSVGCCGIM